MKTKTMKTMQEILNLALESNLYISREEYDKLKLTLSDDHSYYMCDVLGTICADDLITQEEFDKLKLYLNDNHSYYMCDILKTIYSDDLITQEEHEFATDEIAKYIGENSYSCMSFFLQKHSLPSSHEDKVKIYKNWDLRPRVTSVDC